MYCPNCGRGEQEPDSYCRQCGEFLVDPGSRRRRGLRSKTPEESIRTSLVLNLLSSAVSLVMAVLLYATHIGREDAPPVVFVAAALFTVIGIWQMFNFVIGLRLRRHFGKRRNASEAGADETPEFEGPVPGGQLKPADFENVVPASVTEKTTRRLVREKPRNSGGN